MHPKSYYLDLRKNYTPENIKLIFVFESPPESGSYFYDSTGPTSEPLFKELMKLINVEATTKHEGLTAFMNRGLLLTDATFTPVNGISNNRLRDKTIMENFANLKQELLGLSPNQETPVVLAKVNVCDLLEKPLKQAGFNILNQGLRIPFPSTGNQRRFHEAISMLQLENELGDRY